MLIDGPKVSVYIPSHNYGHFLSDAIKSVLSQRYKNWELLLINDGSSDNTQEIFERYADGAQIRTFNTGGIGLPAVCNFAISQSTGDFIVRLDGDDLLDPYFLLVLTAELIDDPSLVLVFPDLIFIDENGEVIGEERRASLWDQNLVPTEPPNGACMLIRKSLFEEVGLYRTDLGAQDGLDLWLKVKDKFKTKNINIPLFSYRKHETNLTSKTSKIDNARRRIKRDFCDKELSHLTPVVAFIPCRAEHDYTKNVWRETVSNKSLLEHSIDACLASPLINYVAVGCDNDEVLDVVRSYNDKRLHFFKRRKEDTLQPSGIMNFIQQSLAKIDPELRGVSLVKYSQTPFLKTETLEEALFSTLVYGANSAEGVIIVKGRLYRRRGDGLERIPEKYGSSKDLGAIYRDANVLSVFRNTNLSSDELLQSPVVNFEISEREAFFVNSAEALQVARILND